MRNDLNAFKAMLLKTRPKQRLAYYIGGSLAEARHFDYQLDQIADYVMTLVEIGSAVAFQKREDGVMHYYVSLTGKLTSRSNQQGSFQEAERLRNLDRRAP